MNGLGELILIFCACFVVGWLLAQSGKGKAGGHKAPTPAPPGGRVGVDGD